MDRFEHRAALADVCARDQTQAANQTGAQIRNYVAIEVFAKQYVELFGTHHQLHRRIVDDHLSLFDLRIKFADFLEAPQEQSVRHLHDVRFMNDGNLFSLFFARVREGEASDSGRSFFGNDFQALNHAGHDFMLDSRIQAFSVLADQDQVEPGIAARDVGQSAHRPEVGIEVERFSQSDIDGSKAFADRRGNGTLQGNLVALN